jgi:hypothetical protein
MPTPTKRWRDRDTFSPSTAVVKTVRSFRLFVFALAVADVGNTPSLDFSCGLVGRMRPVLVGCEV